MALTGCLAEKIPGFSVAEGHVSMVDVDERLKASGGGCY
jgi:hypothetical protein